MSTAYSEASVILPNSAGIKAGTLQAWRPDVNLLQDIDVSRPATTNVASYVNSAGVRVFVGANVPRWDWSEGLSCPSLLVEKQRTNLFDQDLAGAGIVTQTVTVVSGTEYSVSVEGNGSMTLSGAGTGTVTEGSHVTFTASTTSLTLTLTGALDYCQVEAGAEPSSIIYTSGSTATRNADVISKTGIASLIGQSEGTLFIDAAWFDLSNTESAFRFQNSSATNRVSVRARGGTSLETLIFKNSVVENSFISHGKTINTFYKIALAYAPNDLNFVIDGSSVYTDNSLNTFSGNDLDQFNSLTPGFNGRIRSISWWKRRLTDAEIQTLTTP